MGQWKSGRGGRQFSFIAGPAMPNQLRLRFKRRRALLVAFLLGALLAGYRPGAADQPADEPASAPGDPGAKPDAPAEPTDVPPDGRTTDQTPASEPGESPPDGSPVEAMPAVPQADAVGEKAVAEKTVELPPFLLSSVEDRTRGIRDPERDAYFAVLAKARDVDYALQEQAGRSNVAAAEQRFLADKSNARKKFSMFVDLITHPDENRGKLFTLHGYIHKIDEMDAGENEWGLKKLYQIWFYTADSYSSPYVIVCSEIPKDIPMPRRGSPTTDVVTTGYFFKLWSFEAARGTWGAPLMLAQRIEWKPAPAPPRLTAEQKAAIGVGMAAAAAFVAFLIWRRAATDRLLREAQRARFNDPIPDHAAALRDLERDDRMP